MPVRLPARTAHLLLSHHEQDVLAGPHGHRLAEDADPQAPGRHQGTWQLRRALLQVHAALAHVGHNLPVPAVRERVRVCTGRGAGTCFANAHPPWVSTRLPLHPISETRTLRLRGRGEWPETARSASDPLTNIPLVQSQYL